MTRLDLLAAGLSSIEVRILTARRGALWAAHMREVDEAFRRLRYGRWLVISGRCSEWPQTPAETRPAPRSAA